MGYELLRLLRVRVYTLYSNPYRVTRFRINELKRII
jgi:hypothetical protein